MLLTLQDENISSCIGFLKNILYWFLKKSSLLIPVLHLTNSFLYVIFVDDLLDPDWKLNWVNNVEPKLSPC
jgi:hypothetical protein